MSGSKTVRKDDVVLAKLAVPELPSNYVSRPYLFKRFKNSLSWKIILVAAPVGYGKTILLSEWSHALLEEGTAFSSTWLSLDAEDDRSDRFWRHLLASLGSLWPDIIDDNPYPILDKADDAAAHRKDLKEFHVGISNFLYEKTKHKDRQYVLFLDNIDSLSSSFFAEVMNFFAVYFPASVHVVAAGSLFPSNYLDYHHLDSVYEFPPADLAFSRQELLTFMAGKFGDAASEGIVNELYELTQGWATGIRLFADSVEAPNLRNMTTLDTETLYALVDRFYSSCVFKEIQDSLALFLVQSSVSEKINADFCNYLTERSDSKAVIAELIDRSFFIENCDDEDGWYCYHPLFLRWLRSKLFQMRPAQIRELCVRAQEWFEQHNYPYDAAKYMLMACDADLIENLAASAHFRRKNTKGSFISWICDTPARQIPQDPTLSLFATWGYLCCGRVEDTLEWLGIFQENLGWIHLSEPEIIEREDLHAASIVVEHIKIKCKEFKGHYRESIAAYKNLLETQDTMSLSLRVLVLHAIAESYERTGEFSLALEYYLQTEAVADLARSPFFVAFSRYATCWILAFRGELKNAEETCKRALEDCPKDFTIYGALHSVLAYIQIERNEIDKAGMNIEKAMKRLSFNRNADMLFEANIVEASHLATLGEFDEAYRLIVQTVLQVEHAGIPRAVLSFAYTTQAIIAFLRNNVSDAIIAHKRLLKNVDPDDLLYILRAKQIEARIHYVQGDFDSALAISEGLLQQARRASLNTLVIETLLMQATALDEAGRKTRALSALNEALRLASRQGAVRAFLREGERIRTLLHEVVNIRKTDSFTHGFTRTILKAFKSDEAPMTETNQNSFDKIPFTRRELEVLSLLNTGMSRQEIAETLGVSHNTVKTHLNNIYSKLGVSNRTEVFRLTTHKEQSS